MNTIGSGADSHGTETETYCIFQNFDSAQMVCDCATKQKLEQFKTTENIMFYSCFFFFYIYHPVDTDVYTTEAALSLQATDKAASTGTNRRDFCMPICSAAPNQPGGIFLGPPGLSNGLLLPNDRYEVQSRLPTKIQK